MGTAIAVIVAVVAIAAIAALIYLATLEGSYQARRSLLMNVDRERVFDKVRDLKSWRSWSPWLMHEPDAKLEYSSDTDSEGAHYSWDGARVGAGKLIHTRLDQPNRIEQRIEFVRPFKSVAKVWWEFEAKDGQTEVTWGMEGRMPFLLRFMTPTTCGMIANDYELGLAMLRRELDETAEAPVIEFAGERDFEPRTVLTLAFEGPTDELGEVMGKGFTRLSAALEAAGGSVAGRPFAAYHKVDIKARQVQCDMAVPVAKPITASDDLVVKTLGGGKYFKVTQRGSYDFLELTWYSAISHLRMAKIKMDKSRPSLEVYENDPCSVEQKNELLTALFIPIKG